MSMGDYYPAVIAEPSQTEILADALIDYTNRRHELEQYIADNSLIFETMRAMEALVGQAETDLKEMARTAGPIENDWFKVTTAARTKRWYDADTILALAPYVKDMPGVMTVDRDRINELAKTRAFTPEVTERAYREEPMTTAVTIKAKAVAG